MTRSPNRGQNVTALLDAHRAGDETAFDQLVEVLYPDLRRLARRWRSGPDATLDTTAMVHEAYLKLAGGHGDWRDRGHFFAAAARVMRHIAVDYARRNQRGKRGGDRVQTDFQEQYGASTADLNTILAVDVALGDLEATSARTVRVVECRYFAGMTVEETAAALEMSVSTVEREWRTAKRTLSDRLRRQTAS